MPRTKGPPLDQPTAKGYVYTASPEKEGSMFGLGHPVDSCQPLARAVCQPHAKLQADRFVIWLPGPSPPRPPPSPIMSRPGDCGGLQQGLRVHRLGT